ncbi:MAG: hypothetical protein JO142_04305 [Burkholderiales bacterium]|nr:hypothetical protein [Burkholderiales bacterium]
MNRFASLKDIPGYVQLSQEDAARVRRNAFKQRNTVVPYVFGICCIVIAAFAVRGIILQLAIVLASTALWWSSFRSAVAKEVSKLPVSATAQTPLLGEIPLESDPQPNASRSSRFLGMFAGLLLVSIGVLLLYLAFHERQLQALVFAFPCSYYGIVFCGYGIYGQRALERLAPAWAEKNRAKKKAKRSQT